MPSNQGIVRCRRPNELLATFMFEHGTPVVFRGATNQAIPIFNGTAMITYSDQSKLTGTEQFSGKVGSETLQLRLGDSGATISGQAEVPTGNPDTNIQGRGMWN